MNFTAINLMASSDVGNTHEEINPVTGKLLYKEILDIPAVQLFHELSQKYISKINTQPGLPKVAYWIVLVLSFIQLAGPSLLLDIPEIWDDSSIFTQFMRYIGTIWHSYYSENGQKREISSLILSIFVVLYGIISSLYTYQFKTKQTVERKESMLLLLFGKYIYTLFAPLIGVGILTSIYEISKDVVAISIYTLIFGLISLACLFYFLVLQCARLLMENNPAHEWDSTFKPLFTLIIVILNVLGVAASITPKIGKVAIIIIMIIIYAGFGLYTFMTRPTIKYQASNHIAALSFASSLTSIINLIIFFTGTVNGAIIVVIFAVLLVLSFIICSIITKKKLYQLIGFMSMCEDQHDDCQDLMANRWRSKRKFVSDMRLAAQTFHPFYLSWKPFNFGFQTFSGDYEIVLMWCRIVALFPKDAELFRWLMSQFSNQKDSFNRSNYLFQMIEVTESRITATTPNIRKQLDDAKSTRTHVKALEKRFWENILQKSTESFWNDVSLITRIADKLEIHIKQLIDTFPNNLDIIEFYCLFLLDIKADVKSYKVWQQKYLLLKSGGRLKIDSAISAAQDFLPEIKRLCSDALNTKENYLNSPLMATDESIDLINIQAEDSQLIQLRISLQEIIQRSKFGSILIGCVIILIGTVATLVVFAFFILYFRKNFIDGLFNKYFFIRNMNQATLYIAYLALEMASFPFVDDNLVAIDAALMTKLAPTLFPSGRIQQWSFSRADISETSTLCILQFEEMNNAFSVLDTNEDIVRSVYDSLYREVDGAPAIQSSLMKYLLNMISLLSSYPTAHDYLSDQRFIEFDLNLEKLAFTIVPVLERFVSDISDSKRRLLTNLNSYMVLVIFLCLVFITMPLIIMTYSNQVNSDHISSSFIAIPNTAVREIIANQFHDKKDSESDSDKSALLSSSGAKQSSYLFSFIEFLATFIVVLIACIFVYFTAISFSEKAIFNVRRTAVVHSPIFFTAISMYRLVRLSHYNYYTPSQLGSVPITYHQENGAIDIATARKYFRFGFWGNYSMATLYDSSGATVERFQDLIPFFNMDKMPDKPFSLFEELAVSDYIDSEEIALTAIDHLLRRPPVDIINSNFPYILYYLMTYNLRHRDGLFTNAIMTEIEDVFDGAGNSAQIIEIVVYVVQIVAIISVIWFFIEKKKIMDKSLQFFMFFNPQVILNNANIMSLLGGKVINKVSMNSVSTFKNSDKIISLVTQGIVLLDTDLKVRDGNKAFKQFVGLEHKDIFGKHITDIVKTSEKMGFTMADLVIQTQDILKGLQPPQFTKNLVVNTVNGDKKNISVNVISLTSSGAAAEGEFRSINMISYIIEDLTSHFEIEQVIKEEQKKTAAMLVRVMPPEIVEQLQNGAESISFAVQSASIACVRVSTETQFSNSDKMDAFIFYGKVFEIFDEMREQFPLLSKIRTFSHTYTYAGGLFSQVNKPDKHAEEATRFALKLITSIPEIEQKVGHRIKLTIGMNTGGPLVAGVLSLNKPSFQFIGPPLELAQQMKASGVPNMIHATRAVYELIYAYNFNVQERGDTKIRGGRTLRTYIIQP